MPQMAPLKWMSLYSYFSIIFVLMITMNYYMYLYTPNYKKFEHTNKKLPLNWKW
uniref:ATP synthase complex subunit 8 n=1 Tax=Scolytinae sp. BMNH 1040319 TaxID=1903789 RepID=A0A343A570_9CUCU|nr:ATP synthase F0 subunit 8 [Scolytinae sp. BMNH 1040319]